MISKKGDGKIAFFLWEDLEEEEKEKIYEQNININTSGDDGFNR